MKRLIAVLAACAALVSVSGAYAQGASRSVSFNAASVSGFPSGAVSLTGGGVFDPLAGFLKTGGSFRCTADINQGPLAGCRAGEGVRWDASEIVPSTTFKCTGSAAEAPKTAFTGDGTVVMRADFYRQGDGVNESFVALMIVSAGDLDPDLPGIQNVWVQGVGCGEAIVNLQ